MAAIVTFLVIFSTNFGSKISVESISFWLQKLFIYHIEMIKDSRTGHSAKVSLWYVSLLTNTRFRFAYFRISNC